MRCFADRLKRRPWNWLPIAALVLAQQVAASPVVFGALTAPAANLRPAAPGSASAAAVVRGWQQVNLPANGSYFWLYVPPAWDGTTALPLVLFFHGTGSNPDAYLSFLFPAAEAAGCLVAAPKSSGVSWETGVDDPIVAATQAAVQGMVPVDPLRVSAAGHSAGGAYAYLLTYGTVSRYSAVFSMSAPFYGVSAVADPAYKAPIHMYYGTTDPNYTGGAYASLQHQWDALGVSWESDVEAGYGHNNWPPESMVAGFQFLVGRAYGAATCIADPTHLCLQHGRYRVAVTWQDGNGHSGAGSVVPGAAADSGLFWFFAPDNWEMMVKVLDGCAVNQRIWVFAAATTTVQYTLTVTDTVTGQVSSYQNPAGHAATPVTDTSAFATCP